jgi:hypothetical protein
MSLKQVRNWQFRCALANNCAKPEISIGYGVGMGFAARNDFLRIKADPARYNCPSLFRCQRLELAEKKEERKDLTTGQDQKAEAKFMTAHRRIVP